MTSQKFSFWEVATGRDSGRRLVARAKGGTVVDSIGDSELGMGDGGRVLRGVLIGLTIGAMVWAAVIWCIRVVVR